MMSTATIGYFCKVCCYGFYNSINVVHVSPRETCEGAHLGFDSNIALDVNLILDHRH